MKHRRSIPVILAVAVIVLASIACGSSTEGEGGVATFAATEPETEQESESSEPTLVPNTNTPAPTATPAPTDTPEIEGLVRTGTHIVGSDIESGIYVGAAGEDLLDSCYWARLSNLTGSDDILANENAMGLYYVEVLEDDRALETACELVPIENVPAREEFLNELSPGTYIVGRDIEAGTYRGEAGEDIMESCYWARLRNVSGENDIIANDNATGQYFVEVLPTDFSLRVGCDVAKIE